MTDVSQGRGWWQASDGKWYPPHLHRDYLAGGHTDEAHWWQASDGQWYPPETNPTWHQPEPEPPAEEDGAHLLGGTSATGQQPSVAWSGGRRPENYDERLDLPDPKQAVMHTHHGVGLGDLPPGARLEQAEPPASNAAIVSLVLAIVVWPVGIVVAHRARRRLARTGEGGRTVTTMALWIGYLLGLATVVAVVLVMTAKAFSYATAAHLQTAVVGYENTQLAQKDAAYTATSAACLPGSGTHWTCQVSLSNGTVQPIGVNVTSGGAQWAVAEGTQQVTGNAADRVAQVNLTSALMLAKTVYLETNTYGTTTKLVATLQSQTADFSYTAQGSSGQDVVSVDAVSPTEIYLSILALQTGNCWITRDQDGPAAAVSYSVVTGQSPGTCKASDGVAITGWSSTYPGS